MKWQPKDIIAAIIVVCCFVLLTIGRDTMVAWALLGVVAAYYGIDLTPFIKLGRNQRRKEDKSNDGS